MVSTGDYPIGAFDDPNAPYNELTLTVSFTATVDGNIKIKCNVNDNLDELATEAIKQKIGDKFNIEITDYQIHGE